MVGRVGALADGRWVWPWFWSSSASSCWPGPHSDQAGDDRRPLLQVTSRQEVGDDPLACGGADAGAPAGIGEQGGQRLAVGVPVGRVIEQAAPAAAPDPLLDPPDPPR